MTALEMINKLKDKADKAHREICNLASGKRKWEMCIPPQGTDSDMTLQAPLDSIPALCEMLTVALDALEKIEAEAIVVCSPMARKTLTKINSIAGAT